MTPQEGETIRGTIDRHTKYGIYEAKTGTSMTPQEPEISPLRPSPNPALIRLQHHMAIAALLSMPRIATGSPSPHIPEPTPERPCVVCGAPKRHNNSYCSAECCKKDRENGRGR